MFTALLNTDSILTMKHLSMVALLLATVASPALAQDPLKGRAEINGRAGNDRSILMTEFWVPFSQNETSVIYGDLRLMEDSHDNHEGNIGVGYREIKSAPGLGKGVAGIHAWIDRRLTKRGSKFHQATLGGEWLGKEVDIRANGYIPLSDKKEYIVANTSGNSLVGNTIQVGTNGTLVEEPLHGFDLELGYELGSSNKFIRDNTDSFRVYGGGYYFDGNNTDSIQGVRGRFTTDVTQNIQLGGRLQYDNERDTQGFLEMTYRFPFDVKQSFRQQGLRALLDESPERDIDIVTSDAITDIPERATIINKITGLPQEILIVDNTAAGGGDGSAETPFNSLADAESAASAQTIVYVRLGDGTVVNQDMNYNLDETGQQLIGSGTAFRYDSSRYTTANGKLVSNLIITPATSSPILTNTSGGNAININADNVKVAGIQIDSADDDGITANNANNLQIEDVTINNSGNDGLDIFFDDNRSHTISINNTKICIPLCGRCKL